MARDIIPLSLLPEVQQGCAVGTSGCEFHQISKGCGCSSGEGAGDLGRGREQHELFLFQRAGSNRPGEDTGLCGCAFTFEDAFTGEAPRPPSALIFPLYFCPLCPAQQWPKLTKHPTPEQGGLGSSWRLASQTKYILTITTIKETGGGI